VDSVRKGGSCVEPFSLIPKINVFVDIIFLDHLQSSQWLQVLKMILKVKVKQVTLRLLPKILFHRRVS
jgi:hypothetical protein